MFSLRHYMLPMSLLLLSLLSTYASAQTKFTEAEVSAIQAVQAKMKPATAYVLNLGDSQQYAYVMAMLRASGATAAKSPHFFKLVEAERAKHKDKAAPPQLASEHYRNTARPAAQGASDVAPITPINTISYMNNNNNLAVKSLLVSSVPGGTQSTLMTMNYRMANQSQPFATSPAYAQYNQGTQFEQAYSATAPTQGSVIASALIVTTVNNVPTFTTDYEQDSTPNPIDQCVTAPNYGNFQAPPTSCPPVGSACINKGNITTNIVSCYGRNSSNPPCNYGWGGAGYPPNLTLAICGSMTFPNPVDPSLNGYYSIYLQRKNDGGCTLPGPSGSLPAANFSISPTNPNVLNYSFLSAQFPSNSCMQTVWVDMYLTLRVGALIDVPGSGANYGVGTVSSDPTNNPNLPSYALIPTITVLQGCVASGTKITMADGSFKAIETIKGDGSEWLRINPGKDKLAVMGLADGVETKPMVRITDDAGHSVLVTGMHPIVTGRGMIPAKRVKVGDTVTTEKGNAQVRRIERVHFSGKVWNLTYGPPSVIGEGKSTFFANGILIGDLAMQQRMNDEARKTPPTKEEVLSELPKQWRQDYLNWLAEQEKAPKE